MIKIYKEINMEMGERIRNKRKLLGWSSEKLADLMEISNQFLCDVELGKKSLSYKNLKNLCKILCVSADYIILGKEQTEMNGNILEIIQNLDKKYLPLAEASLVNLVNLIAAAEKENK